MCPILYVRAGINVRILLSPLWEAREEFLSEWSDNPDLIALRQSCPLSANYRKLVRNHTCMGCLGSHYRAAFRAAATCVMRAP